MFLTADIKHVILSALSILTAPNWLILRVEKKIISRYGGVLAFYFRTKEGPVSWATGFYRVGYDQGRWPGGETISFFGHLEKKTRISLPQFSLNPVGMIVIFFLLGLPTKIPEFQIKVEHSYRVLWNPAELLYK